MWHRVFGRSKTEPSPVFLLEHLHSLGLNVVPHFKGDDLGWTQAELHLPSGGSPILMARFLTEEDDLRDDLNAYAAELETMNYDPNHVMLMERVIQTQQLITLRQPLDCVDESFRDRVLQETQTWLAAQTDGVFQVDGQGWSAADGTKLLTEY